MKPNPDRYPYQADRVHSDYATITAHAAAGDLDSLRDWQPAADDRNKTNPDLYMGIPIPGRDGTTIPGAIINLRRVCSAEGAVSYHAFAPAPTQRMGLGRYSKQDYEGLVAATRELIVGYGEQVGSDLDMRQRDGRFVNESIFTAEQVPGLLAHVREGILARDAEVSADWRVNKPTGTHTTQADRPSDPIAKG